MFQNQAKSKLQALSSHKKMLKKEVIELRKTKEEVESVESESDAALHVTCDSISLWVYRIATLYVEFVHILSASDSIQ